MNECNHVILNRKQSAVDEIEINEHLFYIK